MIGVTAPRLHGAHEAASIGGATLPVEPQTLPTFGTRILQRGVFLTFEGIEGSGKSVQVSALARRLKASGMTVVSTREPGGTRLGKRLRAILLSGSGEPVSAEAELHLYVADRAQHLTEIVEPALERGDVVLCDRYADATFAYQGHGRMLSLERIYDLHRHPPLDRKPDRTVLLDVDPTIGLERARRRAAERGPRATEDRIEAEGLDFHRRVRDGYLSLAALEPARFRIVRAEDEAAVVERRIWDAVSDLFPGVEG